MRALYTQVIPHLQTVPVLVWVALILYGGSIWMIDRFGLPFKNRYKGASCQEKHISHGFARKLEVVSVYDLWYTEANVITIIGILGLIVAFVFMYFDTYMPTIPALFLLAAAYSDVMDGKTCIRWDCHSNVGTLLDPIRDRFGIVLVLVSIVKTVGLHPFWIIPCMFLAVFEIRVGLTALFVKEHGMTLNSHGPGKQRQVIHLVMITIILSGFYLFDLSPTAKLWTVTTCIVVMTVASMCTFLHYNKKYGKPYTV